MAFREKSEVKNNDNEGNINWTWHIINYSTYAQACKADAYVIIKM